MEDQRDDLAELAVERRSLAMRRNLSNQVRNRRRRYRVGTTWRYLDGGSSNRAGKSSGKSSCSYWEHYPSLSFYGVWLELAGFEVGDEVEIEVKHNELVIRNLGPVSIANTESRKNTNNDNCPDQSQIKYP